MKQSNAITQGALYIAIYIVLLIATIFIPFLAIVSVFLLPIPFVIYTYKFGIKHSLIMFIATIFVSMIVLSVFTLPVTVLSGLGGMAIGWALNERKETYETWARGTIGFSLGLGFVYVLLQFVFKVNWSEEIKLLLDDTLQNTVKIFSQMGQELSEEAIQQLREQLESFLYLIPTLIVIAGIVITFITLFFSYKIINRLDRQSFKFPEFRNFNLPSSIIWYYLIGIILLWIFNDPSETMYLAAVNIQGLTGFLLLLQGISFLFYFTHYKNWSKAIPISLIILLVLFPVLLLYPIRILGIIDLGLQLRNRLTKS